MPLLIQGNRILLQDRKHISKYGEEWSFFGGDIEAGETPYEALIREICEELGVDISGWEMQYLGEIVHYTSFAEYHRFLFGIRIPDAMTAFTDHEGSGAHFFDIDALGSLKFHTSITAEISQLRENFLQSDTFLKDL